MIAHRPGKGGDVTEFVDSCTLTLHGKVALAQMHSCLLSKRFPQARHGRHDVLLHHADRDSQLRGDLNAALTVNEMHEKGLLCIGLQTARQLLRVS